jgi:hypothetical protein
MAHAPHKDSEWRPWGLYDHEPIPDIPESTFSAAMDELKVEDDAQRDDLKTRLREVAITYWHIRRSRERPAPKWYRQQVKPIRQATNNLLSLLQKPADGTGRSALVILTKLRMQRPLKGSTVSERESIEQLLESFISVCDECLRQKGSAGAKKKSHVEEAVRKVAEIWREFSGERLHISLDTEFVKSRSREEFTYRGLRFVQFVLQGIDREVSNSEIATAVRKLLGKKRVQKSASR